MNPRLVELALKKQALQIRADQQRTEMLRHLRGIESALDLVDRARDQVRWAREHVPLLSSVVLIAALVRPRATLRVARRAWLGWIVFRKLGQRFAPALGAFERWRAARL
ncbi:YqjK-like family protein [Aromatoleum anaerobium]|uniref:YqjK-like protein n=1 Tax=Aromatoleum anaerobium TaxID=182180 RepID=A0ABX1PQ78_9RHOO|nr:YqjK-like family protein [Aromatoleum anaerobium]MCK0506028.1 YqjK-like family protein [Aromatoleum anaerobium]